MEDNDKQKENLEKINRSIFRKVFSRDRTDRESLDLQTEKIGKLATDRVMEKLGTSYNTDFNELLSSVNKKDALQSVVGQKSSLAEKIQSTSNKGRININDLVEGSEAAVINDLFYSELDRINRYDSYAQIKEYIPELGDVIDIYAENIVSPESFADYSLGYSYNDDSNPDNNGIVEDRISYLIEKYKVEEELSDFIKDVLALGDGFKAVLPYKLEADRLLNEDGDFIEFTDSEKMNILMEQLSQDIGGGYEYFKSATIEESVLDEYMDLRKLEEIDSAPDSEFHNLSEDEVDIRIKELTRGIDLKRDTIKSELNEFIDGKFVFNNDWRRVIKSSIKGREKEEEFRNKELDKFFKTGKTNVVKKKDGRVSVETSGSIVLDLDPRRTVKLRSKDGFCYGYFYIENSAVAEFGRSNSVTNMGSSVLGQSRAQTSNILERRVKEAKSRIITDVFINQAKDKIDKKFIEDHPEFREIIYSFLSDNYKEDELISISFIPSNYVVHFGEINKKDGYGKSVFESVLFMSKLYLVSLISSIMQMLVFSQEQRIFYVETGLEGDMEASIQSFIKTLKGKEFKAKDLKDINVSMQHIGSFHDLFVPKADSEKPIEIESIPSRDVSINEEFLEYLKNIMVSGTGVPPELLSTTKEAEFAKTVTMRHGRMVRSIIKSQKEFARSYKRFLDLLYHNEYIDSDEKSQKEMIAKQKELGSSVEEISSTVNIYDADYLKIEFPQPLTLMSGLISDQLRGVKDIAEFITNSHLGDGRDLEEDPVKKRAKTEFQRRIIKDYLPNIDWERYDTMFESVMKDSVKKELAAGTKEEDDYR